MTLIALPAAVVRGLRDPVPDAKDFTPTTFRPAATKAWFVEHCTRFISADFPRHHFTSRFYGQLMNCFGLTAHYDKPGFWIEYFASNAGKVEFLGHVLSHHCYGDPCHTFSDAEREIIERMRRTGILDIYRQRLCIEQEAADRAELAQLTVKYGQGPAPADPGVMRTVLVPMNRPAPPRPLRRHDDAGQLGLGLG